jgi:hypothetical protein
MNFALLAANANQLKYLLETAENRPLFLISIVFISSSILIQFLLKIFLIITCCFNYNDDDEARMARKINNFRTGMTAVIGLINVATSVVTVVDTFIDKEIFSVP